MHEPELSLEAFAARLHDGPWRTRLSVSDVRSKLTLHRAWLAGSVEGEQADLSEFDLRGVDLRSVGLSFAEATLTRACLLGASLRNVDLRGANLRNADMSFADLTRTNLTGACLRRARLCGADLRHATLQDANLSGADLRGALLPPFQLPGGRLIVWDRALDERGVLVAVKLAIPEDAQRTANLTNRTCRAERAEVISIEGAEEPVQAAESTAFHTQRYVVGETTTSEDYDGDIRLEDAPGIRFFCTRAEV